jgi:hypothetical protein
MAWVPPRVRITEAGHLRQAMPAGLDEYGPDLSKLAP